jgi:hypothetical protein
MDVRIRQMTAGDVSWAARLAEHRRAEYATYSPVLWRPAPRVRSRHAAFLAGQITNPLNVALRANDGFIIGQRRGAEMFVDDFAVGLPDQWATDGAALLLYAYEELASRGADVVRVVTAAADSAKVRMLTRAGLRTVEHWWVRPVDDAAGVPVLGPVESGGVQGVVAAAPPVYDPGGAVFTASVPSGDLEPERIATVAAERGCVLAVAPVVPGSVDEYALLACGWTIASQWFTGVPRIADG